MSTNKTTLDPKTIIALDAKYPAQRWVVRMGDEGDYSEYAATPEKALADALSLYCNTPAELQENYGDVTVGMFTEDAMLLIHVDQLVQEGLSVERALELVAALREQLTTVLNDDSWFGWTLVYDLLESGDLVERKA